MALKFPNLKFFSKADAKSRVFIILVVVVGILFLGYVGVNYLTGGAATTGSSSVAGAPTGLQSVPGAQMNPEFYRAVVQANEQNVRQAQMTGGSAVPTLINVQQQAAASPQNCTMICPSEDDVNAADSVNDLLKNGKLQEDDANALLQLIKNNVSPDEYAALLNELVRKNKLTPDQARLLLEKYKKQHARGLINDSAKFLDALIKSGQLPLETANRLLALQRIPISPADYANELNQLTRAKKITPQTANQLLAQYTQQQLQERAKQGAYALKQMAKDGQITADVAAALADLQSKNIPVDQYESELNRLVGAGKLTPAVAAALLDQYKNQKAGLGENLLSSILAKEEALQAALLNDMAKAGKLSQAEASDIFTLEEKVVNPNDCQNTISSMAQAKKLTTPDMQQVINSCRKSAQVRAAVRGLTQKQENNASLKDYANALKEAVQAGLITPEEASNLLAQYRSMITPITTPGVTPGIEATLPGAEGFAQLQQRVAEGEAAAPPAPVETQQFTTAATQAQTESLEARQQRIQAIQNAMLGQAQTLISSWQQPIVMQHRDGSPPEKAKPAVVVEGGTAVSGGIGGAKGGTEVVIAPKKPLIKAGTIYYGVLDTAVDSDYPDTPVMVTIVQGPFKGARLIGKLALAQGKDKVSLNFNLMDREGWISSRSVNAFAIDPDTARTVMATDVDYHYLLRYGSMFAYSFISGYSQAIVQSGGNTTTGIFGTSTTTATLSPASKIAVGIGKIGDNMASNVAKWMEIPTTVRVHAGVALGILFMAEVVE